MSGSKGRSGGGNRLSFAEHRLAGTDRADRHQPDALTAAAAARVADLAEIYAFHRDEHLRLREGPMSAPVVRELRHIAALLLALDAALDRAERRTPRPPEKNEFDEFLERAGGLSCHEQGMTP